MRYVTYDEDGNLTGCYLQDLLPEHEGAHFEIEEGIAWPAYRMNTARDGLDLAQSVAHVPVVPRQVTARQAHAALIMRGLDVPINAYIDAIADPIERKLTRNEFEKSSDFERDWPLVQTIGAALSLDLDELFTFAATL